MCISGGDSLFVCLFGSELPLIGGLFALKLATFWTTSGSIELEGVTSLKVIKAVTLTS